jgi:hypothetical protein
MSWQLVVEVLKFVVEVARDWRFVLAIACFVAALFYSGSWEFLVLMSLSLTFLFWSSRTREAGRAARYYVPPPREFVVRRNALVRLIRSRGMSAALSLEEFFEGNTDYGSIGCNLSDSPGPEGFYQVLREIRSRPQVQDVLVEVREVDEEDESTWPFSDTLFVLTDAPREVVANWLEPLQPDEVEEGVGEGEPPPFPELQPGMRVLYAWWD